MINILDSCKLLGTLPVRIIFVISVLSTALVNFSIYATYAGAAASIPGVTGNVIPGNSSKFVQHEGLMPTP
ncbi:MAG: hypothetical protein WAM14_00385 [Candidatus Nitrosopolaris sp.]